MWEPPRLWRGSRQVSGKGSRTRGVAKARRLMAFVGGRPLVRYAVPNENFVPVVGPHNGLGARSAPKRYWANQPRALPGYQGAEPLTGSTLPLSSTES